MPSAQETGKTTTTSNKASWRSDGGNGPCCIGIRGAGVRDVPEAKAMETTGRKIYRVRLETDEREWLKEILGGGKGSQERRRRAHVLLLADEGRPGGGLGDAEIARVLEVGASTVERVRRQCVMEGLDAALERKAQANRKKRLLDGAGEAKLAMLACSAPPAGHARWTLKLLGDRLVELEVVDGISRETVRRTLKKTTSSRG